LDFAICISTLDRGDRLGGCLDRLFALEGGGSYELIVVDNGSSDGTAAVLAAYAARSPVPMLVLREQRKGVSYALNTAVLRARGDILVFTDDDCYASPDLLVQLRAVFSDPAVGYVGGRITLHDPEDYPITVRDVPVATRLAGRSVPKPGLVQGAMMAMRRKVALEIGGFDPNFGAGARFSGYDIEACARASALGWAGGYDPRPHVSHHHGRDEAAAARLLDRYRRGCGAYYAKLLLTPGLRLRAALTWSKVSAWHLLTQPRRLTAELRGALEFVRCHLRGDLLPADGRLPPAGEAACDRSAVRERHHGRA
jgi:glycosyltransferase involved in cell wall biosynthesis